MSYVSVTISGGKRVLVDGENLGIVGQFKWHAKKSKGNWYAATRVGKQTVFMHNMLMPPVEGLETDHVDQNGLHNIETNLRYATPSQNRANVRLRSDSTSGLKGVCFYPKTGKWRAYIQKDKKWKQIGYFETKEEAAVAYNEKAKELFGEFAWLNKV